MEFAKTPISTKERLHAGRTAALRGVEQSLHLALHEEVLALLIYYLYSPLLSPLRSHYS
jgi:hypothetical protein